MATRDEMIRQLKRRDMISQLKARDAQPSDPDGEGEATRAAEEKYNSEAPSAAEAAGIGSLQGVTRNWGDELIAGVSKMVGGDYEANKHKIQQRDLRSKSEQPLAYYGANIPMAIATSIGPGGIAKQAALAGADGAARSLGDADRIDEKSMSEAVETGTIDAATAGALAKVAPGLVAKAGEYGEAGSAWLKKVANSQAVKALGGTKGQVEKLGEKANDVGAMVLKNKIVTPLASSKEIADRVSQQGEKLAAQTKPIYEAAEGSTMKPNSLYYEIEAKIADLKSNPGNAPIVAKLKKYQDELIDSGTENFNPADLRKYRQSVDKTINFNSDAPSQMASKDMRNILRDKEMGLISDVNPELAKQNEGLFKDIHLNILAEDMADKGAAKSAVNNEIGMNTWQAGTQAAAAGATGGTSAIAMLGRELVRRYGHQTTAVALDKIASSKFAPVFAKAAEKGPSAVAAVHAALLGNPEYKAMVGE